MKFIPVTLALSIVLPTLSTQNTLPFVSEARTANEFHESYRWVRAVESKKPGWPRWVKPVLGFGNQLWMIDEKLTWNSANGIHWRATKNNGYAAVKPGVGRAFFKNKMWLMGGMKTWAEFSNDIWSSTDGGNWQLVNPNAAWGPRRDHMVVEFAGKLWLMGGAESSGRLNVTPTRSFGDVWNSADGINCIKVTDNAPWAPRGGHAIVFKDAMWVIGGGGTWHSQDGKDWKEGGRDIPALQRRGHGMALFNGKLWAFGGMRHLYMEHEVWSSDDAIHWTQETEHAPWFPRGGEYSIVFQDKLWIYGGKTGVDYDHADDIWYMARR